jgi:hypothetical protein
MGDCKSVATPIEPNANFVKLDEGEPCVDKQQYQALIGCLTYAMMVSRPDLAAAVGVLSQYMSNPGQQHWTGVKRVLRYIKGTVNFGLRFRAADGQVTLSGYSDANWGGCLDDRLSTAGHAFMLGGGCISWRSKKQRSVAKSTTEAELVALSLAAQECIWLRNLLTDVGFEQAEATVLWEDNQGAIELSKRAKFHDRTKHIDISYYFCRERVQRGEIRVEYCPTNDMIADIMTKGVPGPSFQKLRAALGVIDIGG